MIATRKPRNNSGLSFYAPSHLRHNAQQPRTTRKWITVRVVFLRSVFRSKFVFANVRVRGNQEGTAQIQFAGSRCFKIQGQAFRWWAKWETTKVFQVLSLWMKFLIER